MMGEGILRHISALALKFVVVAVILEIILMTMTNLSFGSILWIAVGVTLVAYVVGDLLILPRSNNTMATIVDVLLAFGAIMLFGAFVYGNIRLIDALVASIGIGIGEILFHRFMGRSVLPSRANRR
jgi:hypothetical protein